MLFLAEDLINTNQCALGRKEDGAVAHLRPGGIVASPDSAESLKLIISEDTIIHPQNILVCTPFGLANRETLIQVIIL